MIAWEVIRAKGATSRPRRSRSAGPDWSHEEEPNWTRSASKSREPKEDPERKVSYLPQKLT